MAKNDFIINGQQPASEFTKREKIAAMAMHGLIAGKYSYLFGNDEIPVPSEVAKCAVELADELLKKLES